MIERRTDEKTNWLNVIVWTVLFVSGMLAASWILEFFIKLTERC